MAAITGTDGNDLLIANSTSNTLLGISGDDGLFGHSLVDRLFGESGNDSLFGMAGDDLFSATVRPMTFPADPGWIGSMA